MTGADCLTVRFRRWPVGRLVAGDFEIIRTPLPEPGDGEVMAADRPGRRIGMVPPLRAILRNHAPGRSRSLHREAG